jgi:hypothetical protein
MYETIYITSGARFDFNSNDRRDRDKSAARMGSRSQKARVAIPSDYYKVFLRKEGDKWHSIAFLLEHNHFINGAKWDDVLPHLTDAVVTLEEIEKQAEVNLHPTLNRSDLVQSADGSNWDLSIGKASLEGACSH